MGVRQQRAITWHVQQQILPKKNQHRTTRRGGEGPKDKRDRVGRERGLYINNRVVGVRRQSGD
jgi:hypothetical protein